MTQNHLTEAEIDTLVIAQADDDSAWEEPIQAQVAANLTLPLPPELAQRAAFFARLHNKESAAEWLQSIIQERLDFEEAAFAGIKQAIAEQQATYRVR